MKDRTDSGKDAGKHSSSSMIHPSHQSSAFHNASSSSQAQRSTKQKGMEHGSSEMNMLQQDSKFSSKNVAVSKASKKEVRPLSGGISQK